MISSRSNQRLKAIRRIRRSKGPTALLEGPNLVQDALAAGVPLELVLATPDYLERDAALASRLQRLKVPLLEVTVEVLESVTDAEGPQGVLAIATLPRGGAETLPVDLTSPVYLYLDQLQDPGNLGAIARVAEATGVGGIALSPGCVHPNHPRALRASAGSLLRLPVALDIGSEEMSLALESLNPRWVALVPRDGGDLYETPLEGALILALGAEGAGLSERVSSQAHLGLTIPIQQPVESLNVAVAAAVVLFELARRRRPSL